MDTNIDIKTEMKLGGHRSSQTRDSIIRILKSSFVPLSAPTILEKLRLHKVSVNKTTVYRELEKLEQHSIISPVFFDEQKTHYELNSNHHHHTVCTKCKRVENTEVVEPSKFQLSNSDFKVVRHSLEFFGICKSCQF